jgi:hypothetical protein
VVTFKNPLKQQFMTQFENLTQGEIELLENAIPQIAILIAGADGNIDQDEKDWAAKLTHIRGYANPKALQAFYDAIDPNFNTKFGDFIQSLPKNTEERQAILNTELAKLNDIFPKLEPRFGYLLYQSFVSFAKQIAKASGGMLGFATISRAEKKWVDLPMLTPVEQPPHEQPI